MTYRTEFPDYRSTIPDVFLSAPWRDESWHNDVCPSFARVIPNGDGEEVHVYVEEEKVEDRDCWTSAGCEPNELARYSVYTTDDEGQFIDNSVFYADSLAAVLDHVGFLTGEVAR